MVALGTLHAVRQKQLCDVLKLSFGIFDSFVPGDGGLPMTVRSHQQFADELVVRLIGEQTVADPGMEGESWPQYRQCTSRRFLSSAVPFAGEEVGVVRLCSNVSIRRSRLSAS